MTYTNKPQHRGLVITISLSRQHNSMNEALFILSCLSVTSQSSPGQPALLKEGGLQAKSKGFSGQARSIESS